VRATRRLPWWSTLLYPTCLVLVFLGGQVVAGWLGVAAGQRAALAALPALACLVLSLPRRVSYRWGAAQPWRSLGLAGESTVSLTNLCKGVGLALLLLIWLAAVLALVGLSSWLPRLTIGLLINALVLGLGVGIAEELLFRGWLLGELSLQLGRRSALWFQALIFSLVHIRFNLPPLALLGLLLGLLLLGLLLGRLHQRDGQIWAAVGLHGGLVGGWFLLHNGLIELSGNNEIWTGPANPIGGLPGLLGLAVVLLLSGWRWPSPGGPRGQR
jgi:membrane protease YdiL (CAAX protease family)